MTVVGEENGWVQVSSGEIEGYIREDLLVSGEEAQQLFESVHGDGEITGAQPLDAVVETAAVSNQTTSVSQADLDLMAAIIECEAGGESYEGKVGVGAVIMNVSAAANSQIHYLKLFTRKVSLHRLRQVSLHLY